MKLARQFVASDVVWRPCIGFADLSHFSRVKSLPGQHLVLNEDTLPMARNGLLEAGMGREMGQTYPPSSTLVSVFEPTLDVELQQRCGIIWY